MNKGIKGQMTSPLATVLGSRAKHYEESQASLVPCALLLKAMSIPCLDPHFPQQEPVCAGLAPRVLGCVSLTIITEEFSLFWVKSLDVQVQIPVGAMQPHFPMSNPIQYNSWQRTPSVAARMCRHSW